MNCGFVLADKWRWYQQKVKELKAKSGLPDVPMILDGRQMPDTPEKQVMNLLGITRQCCRKHLLTHRDLIDKV
jgi:DNA-directed RNA polymerase I, II, and III subunit RPABC5